MFQSNGNGYKYIGTMRFRTSQSGDAFESTAFSKGRIVQDTLASSPAVQYYITDHLGSTRMILGSDGSVLGRYEYTPFGVGRAVGSSLHHTDYTFSGKERQPFGSVLDFGARLYDPRAAVWNSIDPLATSYYSVSPYAYCNNNPVILVDANGMDWYRNNNTSYYTWFNDEAEREGFTHIGGKGSLLDDFEGIIDNILSGKEGLGLECLYSEGFTFDIAPNDKGCLLPSQSRGLDFFF